MSDRTKKSCAPWRIQNLADLNCKTVYNKNDQEAFKFV